MNLDNKNKILSFVKDIDDINLTGYIFDFDYDAKSGFESSIQQIFECLFREVFLPKNYKVNINGQDKNPDFNALMTFTEKEIVKVREYVLKLSSDECDLLLAIAQETRNKYLHGTYKKSDNSLKQDLAEILFKALKNAYEYKTNKVIAIKFADFFEAFKYSEKQELRESNAALIASKKTLEDENKELKNKLAIEIERKKVKSETKKEEPKTILEDKPNVEEEIKYQTVIKNNKYTAPKELGKNIELIKSPKIDIAFDFLEKGWFDEAKKEATDANHVLTNYILFLANNNLKNVQDLISSSNFISLLDELFVLLSNLPNKIVEKLLEEVVNSFCSISEKELQKKIYIFKKISSFSIQNESKYKTNFINYLIDSKEDFQQLKKGFEAYFSSFKDKDYILSIENCFNLLLEKHKYDLIFDIKSNILNTIESPTIIRIMLMAEAKIDKFDLIKTSIYRIYNANNLSRLLNYDFYNEEREFIELKKCIIESIENQSESMTSRTKNNAIVLLQCISQYLKPTEFKKLVKKYVSLYMKQDIWPGHKDDCLILLSLIKDDHKQFIDLLNNWISVSDKDAFDFYKEIIEIAKRNNFIDPIVLKTDLLLTLSLTNDYHSFNSKVQKLTNKQIENYIRFTSDYILLNELLVQLPKKINVENAIAYSDSFELLLSYTTEKENNIFKCIKELASKLVSEGFFDRAEKFYRIMLSLNINTSTCYWGLLFCQSKAKTSDELAKTDNLYENELFQATLHLSKEENPSIYQQCLSVYSNHKTNNEKIAKEKQEKKARALHLFAIFAQFAATAGFFALGFVYLKTIGWLFIILAILLFLGVPALANISNYCKTKTIVLWDIIFLVIDTIAFSIVGGVHIHRASNAKTNYEQVQEMINNFDSKGSIYAIQDKINNIPITYKDTKTLKQEAEDLAYLIRNYKYGRDQFGRVWNFDYKHDNWNCYDFYYDYSFYSLLINATWKIDNTKDELSFYTFEGKVYLSSDLPNNKKPFQDYYYYFEYGYYDNDEVFVNQYIKFGYENKNDSSDKFLAFEVGDYRINSQGKRQITAYCYSDNSTHTLIFDKDTTN